jgi:ribonuclease VapC
MIIDTSAIIAILRAEPEALACAKAIEAAVIRRISAANLVEAAIVIDGSHDPIASRRFDDLVKEAQLVIEPVSHSRWLHLRGLSRPVEVILRLKTPFMAG